MPITVRTNKINVFKKPTKPKIFLLYILNTKYIPWEFCMRIMINVFHKNIKEAHAITNEILTNGEGLCGAYMFEIAESKAEIVELQAKEDGFELECLIEEV